MTAEFKLNLTDYDIERMLKEAIRTEVKKVIETEVTYRISSWGNPHLSADYKDMVKEAIQDTIAAFRDTIIKESIEKVAASTRNSKAYKTKFAEFLEEGVE